MRMYGRYFSHRYHTYLQVFVHQKMIFRSGDEESVTGLVYIHVSQPKYSQPKYSQLKYSQLKYSRSITFSFFSITWPATNQ
jgi:hypothetical protein